MENKEYSLELGGRTLTLKFLNWAEQAHGSLLVTYGDTVVLTTAVMGNQDKPLPYFPLTVEYRERYYAGGKIGGGRFMKREGRPSDEATLKARLIDRALRPLFNHAMRREVQIVNNVFSYDNQNMPDILGLIGSSMALFVSEIPWAGPIGAVRVGRVDNNWVLNPSAEAQEKSDLNLTITGTTGKINMIEVGAQEASEEDITEAIAFGTRYVEQLIEFQKKIQAEIGAKKAEVPLLEADESLKKEVREFTGSRLKEALVQNKDDGEENKLDLLNRELKEHLQEKYGEGAEEIGFGIDYLDSFGDEIVHELALKENKRVDGRKFDEVRELSASLGPLPRAHGSAVFMRGLTHALSVVTLASPGNEELHDDMEGESKKSFMHHYNFPPFSTGETGFFRGPGRREIGHGALAEKALAPLIPSQEKFPYVIRLVSEILSSNGSSSMASVCGSSLALMDAGVPIKGHIAGVAMGLIASPDGGEYKILTDIQGPEDHHGDMDLKVAGTRTGVTAMQMDVKIDGVSLEVLKDAIEEAKKARNHILTMLEGAIAQPREGLSPYAPIIQVLKINPERIGSLIGAGGRTIREIMAATETEINVEEDGSVFISGSNPEQVKKAIDWAEGLTHEIKVGEVFKAKVVRIADFGAFVELTPGQDALVHVSELANDYVKDVKDVVKMGDFIEVKVIKVDDQGKISASVKQVKKLAN